MSDFLDRVAAAPISWGVCEAPGWGLQLPVDRVLGEARQLGITAVEQGALGWLPTEPGELKRKLHGFGMRLLGGFVPLVLHDRHQRASTLERTAQVAANLAAAGGDYFVTAAVASLDDWFRPTLDESSWNELFDNIRRVDEICSKAGLMQVVHPHLDTLIETRGEFERFVDSCDSKICFDTGHLVIGGSDVISVASELSSRIGVVHLKDVDATVAERERSGDLDLVSATHAGLFPSLGDGMVGLDEVVRTLESAGYGDWYVMETDVAIIGAEPPVGEGPVRGVERSLAYLRSIDGATAR